MTATATTQHRMTKEERKVIFASSLGTVFEWYDFYLYGSLAAIIGKQFFSGVNETTAFIFALMAFAAGFAVRPFGAVVFGRLGDLVGRKYTFLITIMIMGLSTFVVGLLPNYASIGVAAPVILVLAFIAGLGAGRRIRRCGDLCGGTCAAKPARRIYRVDPNHGNAGLVSVADRDHADAQLHRHGFRVVGLAHSVLGLDCAVVHFHVDSDDAERIASFR